MAEIFGSLAGLLGCSGGQLWRYEYGWRRKRFLSRRVMDLVGLRNGLFVGLMVPKAVVIAQSCAIVQSRYLKEVPQNIGTLRKTVNLDLLKL